MSFAYPWMFVALVGVALYARASWPDRYGGALGFSAAEPLRGLTRARDRWLGRLGWMLRLAALVLLVVSAARPQKSQGETRRSSEGLDIMLVVDTSASMEAMDFTLGGERFDRLTVVKKVLGDFIAKRPDDRIGMVVFGSEALTQAPLTLDHEVLKTFLEYVKIGMAGPNTAIGDAIAVATKRLKDLAAKSKVIILLTDGSNTAGTIDPATATEAARQLGVKIYTIGVGTNGQAPYPVQDFFGSRLVYRPVEIDTEALKTIAERTGARAFLASNTENLVEIYTTIDQLEKTKVEVTTYTVYEELYRPLVALALLLVLGEAVLGTTRFRRLPA